LGRVNPEGEQPLSLNWKEIDLVLSELELPGAQIQKIIQPSYDTLLLSLYQPGRPIELLICVAHGACRLHETRQRIPKAEKPQRFMELLRAQVKGARIVAAEQLGAERIVRLQLQREDGERILYLRLWSGASNIILTRPDGEIIDALARKPKKGEVSGGHYAPLAAEPPARQFVVRELAGDGSFNQRLDAYYAEHGSELSRQALLAKARSWFASRKVAMEARLDALEKAAASYADPARFRELGDILLASQGQPVENSVVRAEDFYRGGTVLIKVDASRSIVDNAKDYYEKSRKARSGAEETALELAELQTAMARLAEDEASLEREENPYRIRVFLAKRRSTPSEAARRYPGLSLDRNGWLILIGRSAAENDGLLRRHVRGNDTWLHARDWPGAYVFIKNRPGKTIPLDILLDAGTLALYYSKARASGVADLYYTQVKYLRRAKNGPKGLVIPTQEKNLRVSMDNDRLRELRRLIGKDDDSA
jgi:predicted ribosome quality control (RQC) complex YloA/Tae2 family protein